MEDERSLNTPDLLHNKGCLLESMNGTAKNKLATKAMHESNWKKR